MFDIFLRLCEESFEDLQINSNWKFQSPPFKVFVKLQKKSLLKANIVRGAVSGLRQFLATESPWKVIKKYFSFHLKSYFHS